MLLSLQHGPMHPQDMWQETIGCFPSRSLASVFSPLKRESSRARLCQLTEMSVWKSPGDLPA